MRILLLAMTLFVGIICTSQTAISEMIVVGSVAKEPCCASLNHLNQLYECGETLFLASFDEAEVNNQCDEELFQINTIYFNALRDLIDDIDTLNSLFEECGIDREFSTADLLCQGSLGYRARSWHHRSEPLKSAQGAQTSTAKNLRP